MLKKIQGRTEGTGRRVAIVVSRWNELVTKALLEGAVETLEAAGVSDPTVIHVAGAWEIPIAVKHALSTHDGAVALGCILQGATNHAALLAGDVSGALMGLQMEMGKPVSWGILTPENQEQALERTGLKLGHKGREAASSLIETLSVIEQLRSIKG